MNYHTPKRPKFATFCPHFAPYFPIFAPHWGAPWPLSSLRLWLNVSELRVNQIKKSNQFTYDYVKLYIGYCCIRIPVWEGFFSLFHFWKFSFMEFTFRKSLFKTLFSTLTFQDLLFKTYFSKLTFQNLFLKNSLFEINIIKLI